MKTWCVRTELLGVVAVQLLLPLSLHAGAQSDSSSAVGMALAGNDDTVVDDNALGATQAREQAQKSVNALSGGIHQLHLVNLSVGEHTLSAYLPVRGRMEGNTNVERR